MLDARPSSYSCPACPAGTLNLSVEMSEHFIYACDGPVCGASLWVPTDDGNLTEATQRLRVVRQRLIDTIRKIKGSQKPN